MTFSLNPDYYKQYGQWVQRLDNSKGFIMCVLLREQKLIASDYYICRSCLGIIIAVMDICWIPRDT